MRSLQLVGFIALVLLLGIATTPARAASISVDSLLHTNVAGDGDCTLREAVAVANNDTVGHADCGTGSGADTITINVAGTINIAPGAISVSSTITINEGAGDVVLDGGGTSRLLSVATNGDLTVNGLTLQNGFTNSNLLRGGCIGLASSTSLTINGVTLQNCVSTVLPGGAVSGVSDGGDHTVVITNSTFTNNSATDGGGMSMSGTLTVSNSTFTQNTAASGNALGGAILATFSSTSSITDSSFSQNAAHATSGTAQGGAIVVRGESGVTLTISGSTFTSNQARNSTVENQGGAIFMGSSGTLAISGSVFTGNSASDTDGQGGAIYTLAGSTSVTSSRLQSNSASDTGDAYYAVGSGTDSITGSCIVNNGDTAVVDSTGSATTATGNWWGVDWGPLISAAGGGSAVSNGDSISGSGTSLVDVGLTDAGTPSTPPTGNWITVVPSVAGAQCMACADVSSVGHARSCS